MAETGKCSQCGAVLPPDAPGGHCPQCLLNLATDAAGETEIAGPGTAAKTVPPPEAAWSEKPSDRIGRYKLLQQIGEGGMGTVWMAEQEEPVRRRVALKIVKLGMDTKQVIARFEAERQVLALMDHPNIAKVLDAGATDTGRPYFVMELVRGVKITDYCDQHHLPTVERLKLFIKVCQAIQHAHQKGIIHRDIKPSNILVTQSDGVAVPKVIDFGVAKAITDQKLTDKTLFTAFEQFIGTPAYMSPEQAEMSALDIDTRSDIYSLGVLLYELLIGKTPFDAKELFAVGLDAMRRVIREQEPPRPSTRLSTMQAGELTTTAERRQSDPPKLMHLIRGDLDWIVMKTLEKDRARRYETANGLAADLQRHLDHEPVAARPPSGFYRFQKMVRRNQLAFAAGAAIATMLVAAVLVSAAQAVKARKAERQAQAERLQAHLAAERADQNAAEEKLQRQHADAAAAEANQQRQRAEAAIAQARDTLSSAYLSRANGLIVAGNGSEALAYLDGSLAANPTNRAALTWLFDLLTYHAWMLPVLVVHHDDSVRSARFSPDGQRIVTASDDKTVRIWDAQNGLPLLQPIESAEAMQWAEFSPDGKRVVTASLDATARIWDAQTGQALMPPFRHYSGLLTARFSPDGKRLVTTAYDNTARVWDPQRGPPEVLTIQLKSAGSFADFSPDSQRIVTAAWDRTTRIWDALTGLPLAGPFKQDDGLTSAQFSPDGLRILTASWDHTARVWDAQSGHPLDLILKHPGLVSSAQFSADGKRIVTACNDKTVRLWDAASGRPLTEPLEHGGSVIFAEFSPDGKRVVTASEDHAARIWAGNGLAALPARFTHLAAVNSADFSPDGKKIATASDDHAARIWDAESGRPLTGPLIHADEVVSAQFSPDGKWLLTAGGRTARIWNAESGKLLATLGHSNQVWSARFSRDGKRIVTASEDQTARVWDALTGEPVSPPMPHGAGVHCADFSPDGTLVVTGAKDHTAQVWDARTGKAVGAPMPHPADYQVNTAQFSPNGERILTTGPDARARVWDARTGLPILVIAHSLAVLYAEFSPDGRRILTASQDRTARVWDAQSGLPLAQPMQHDDMVWSARFSPDGTRIVTASADGSARVWDALTCQPLSEPLKHDGLVGSACFSPDGKRVLTASEDGTARSWDLVPTQPGYPEWLLPLSQAVCGQVVNQQGTLEPSRQDPTEIIKRVREQLSHGSDQDAWTIWGRWFLGDPLTRTISPFSKLTLREYIEDQIQRNTVPSLEEAERAATGNAELLARISPALERERRALARAQQIKLLQRSADLNARAGKWTNAIADFSQLSALEPEVYDDYRALTMLFVQRGDVEGYHRVCAQVLRRFGGTNDPGVAERIAKDCLLLPDSGMDLETVNKLIAIAMSHGTNDVDPRPFQLVKGLAQYRQGQFADAAGWLQKLVAARGGTVLDAQACLVLAMSHFQLKRTDEARATLVKGIELVDTYLPRLATGDLGVNWGDWAAAQALLSEAKALIEGPMPAAARVTTEKRVLQLDQSNSTRSRVELPTRILDGFAAATIEGWVKWRRFDGWPRVFSFGKESNRISLMAGHNTNEIALCVDEHLNPWIGNILTVPNALSAGEWVHVAGVFTTNGATLLVNGRTVGTSPKVLLAKVKENTQNALGSIPDGLGGWFDGQMAEVRLWKVARTEIQIREDLFRSLTGQEPGLVALWSFADGTARDVTGHGHAGKLVGAARVVDAQFPAPAAGAESERSPLPRNHE